MPFKELPFWFVLVFFRPFFAGKGANADLSESLKSAVSYTFKSITLFKIPLL
jgi:hypothetical protein